MTYFTGKSLCYIVLGLKQFLNASENIYINLIDHLKLIRAIDIGYLKKCYDLLRFFYETMIFKVDIYLSYQ